MIPKPSACPKCDGEVDKTLAAPWGNLKEPYRFPVAPYICSLCGSLLVIELSTGKLHIPPLKGIQAMQANPELWQTITEAQSAIVKLPDRRPVLR